MSTIARWCSMGLNAAGEPANLMAMTRNVPWAGLVVLMSGLTGPGAWAATPQPLPTPFPEARYRQMSAKSPFAVASASSAATAAPTPGFAAQLYVDGVAHVGRTDFVAIKSRDKQSVIFMEVGESTEDGMKVERVKWSGEMGKSTVDVSKGGEKATLIFDEQQMARTAPGLPQQWDTVDQEVDHNGPPPLPRIVTRAESLRRRRLNQSGH